MQSTAACVLIRFLPCLARTRCPKSSKPKLSDVPRAARWTVGRKEVALRQELVSLVAVSTTLHLRSVARLFTVAFFNWVKKE
mmetsp:Transcript_48513/g.105671  ORF Transcript_48513/g.105671 Transcript_48513/m.105671 type:complete len:82 (+) Transcript_48513:1032-1277(+)